jgi:hypothetical protein
MQRLSKSLVNTKQANQSVILVSSLIAISLASWISSKFLDLLPVVLF